VNQSDFQQERAREWTRVPHSSFPRNEGVPGSSPGVGFPGIVCLGVLLIDAEIVQLLESQARGKGYIELPSGRV